MSDVSRALLHTSKSTNSSTNCSFLRVVLKEQPFSRSKLCYITGKLLMNCHNGHRIQQYRGTRSYFAPPHQTLLCIIPPSPTTTLKLFITTLVNIGMTLRALMTQYSHIEIFWNPKLTRLTNASISAAPFPQKKGFGPRIRRSTYIAFTKNYWEG